MRTRLLALSAAPLLLPLALPAQAPGTPPAWVVQAPLADAIPDLLRQSSWRQDAAFEGAQPDKSARGVFPVGNGLVFTYMGLGSRANTMMAISGPRYAASARRLPRGNFGELTLDLGATPLPVQKVRRVTGANFVVTEDADARGLALRTLTFAPPSGTTLFRVITVHNGTSAPIEGLRLRAAPTGTAKPAAGGLGIDYADAGHRWQAVVALSDGAAEGAALVSGLGTLAAGATVSRVLTIACGAPGIGATQPTLPAATQAAEATRAWWKEKLAGTPKLRTDHAKVQDLFDDWKVLMLTMRDAGSGVVTPMVTRRGAMIRESSGPLLVFLRYNLWDEARALLDFFHGAILATGEVREHYPLDLDVKGGSTPVEELRVPDSDLASWVILHHFWYFRATRDAALIKARQPFLYQLLKRQKPVKDSLIPFSGHESFTTPTLYSLDSSAFGRNPLFVAHSPEHGRRAYSLAASVAFLMAIQGYGEMLDGIDRMENPAKWAGDPSGIDKPSQKWIERSFEVMQDIEKQFWVSRPGLDVRSDLESSLQHGDDWRGIFAPAISPVTGQRHTEPFANINLTPLWLGFTFPSGERSRHNLRNTLGRLWHARTEEGKRKNTLVGTTANVGHFTGEVPGMLLCGLVERDGRDRAQALRDLLQIAEPACEWGRLYGPDARPIASPRDPGWPDRLSPNECGIDLDAAIFALNGVRHVNVPNFDNRAIKLKLRLPRGATYLNMDNLKKDGRAFTVHVDEFWAPLNEEERKANEAQSDPKYKRDPHIDHRRFRFRMRLLSKNPPAGKYQVDAHVSGTMFVRDLFQGRIQGTSGEIDEREFWREDTEQFFLDGSPTEAGVAAAIEAVPGAEILALTNRSQCVDVLGRGKVTYVDTGLPLHGPALVRAMLKDGKPTHPILFLDVGFDAADERAFKSPRFWQNPAWERALAAFRDGGGKIVRPRYVESFEVRTDAGWREVRAEGGRLELPGEARVVRFEATAPKARDDVVLRLGTGTGYRLRCNGAEIGAADAVRTPLRDADALLVELKEGGNLFEVELVGAGARVLFASFTDGRGLPVDALR